tara:strand:+ start:643 stop:960 length:318 start_codon:yes stop_codon:yes gene_type:complete
MSSTLERLVVSSEQKPTTRLQEVQGGSIHGGIHGGSASGHYIADPKDVLPTISFSTAGYRPSTRYATPSLIPSQIIEQAQTNEDQRHKTNMYVVKNIANLERDLA